MDLFGNLYSASDSPSWVNPFPSGDGFTWDADAPDPNNGHCFVGVGYNDEGVQIDRGVIGTITWKAIAESRRRMVAVSSTPFSRATGSLRRRRRRPAASTSTRLWPI